MYRQLQRLEYVSKYSPTSNTANIRAIKPLLVNIARIDNIGQISTANLLLHCKHKFAALKVYSVYVVNFRAANFSSFIFKREKP